MEVDEFLSGLPERNVYDSVRCRENVTKYTRAFKFMTWQPPQGTVFIFNQFCAVAIAFNCFPGNGKGRWWYFEQAKFIECILTATKSVWYLHTKRSKHKLNLFGKLVEYYTLDDGILNRQSSLSVFSRLPKALDICIPKGQNISLTFSGNLLNIIP